MIIGRDIVVIGIQPWDIEIGSNCKNIAVEMSKHNRILFVNAPIHRLTALRDKKTPSVSLRLDVIKGKRKSLNKVATNIWEFNPPVLVEPINKISFNPLFDFLNRANSKRFAKAINKAVAELDFKNYILFNDSSMFHGYYFNEYLKYDTYIYYIRDNLIKSISTYWNTQGERIEAGMIKKADLVVTNSLYYTQYAKAHSPHSFMVGQGCDLTLFNDQERDIDIAEELNAIPKPIIGYVGFLTTKRLSFDIIEHLALSHPEWSIVLVGPEDDNFKKSRLHDIKNVYFLGSKPSEQLPNFIKGFDICINPQIVNNATIGNYPRKIDEYLAMGKAVVATKTTGMEYFSEYTYLGETKEDYVALTEKALLEDSEERRMNRRKYAKSHSWETNVNEIWKALEKTKEEKKTINT